MAELQLTNKQSVVPHDYQQVDAGDRQWLYHGMQLELDTEQALVFSAGMRPSPALLQLLIAGDKAKLFTALNALNNAFTFILYQRQSGTTTIIADRLGHSKLYLTFGEAGSFQLSDQLPPLRDAEQAAWSQEAMAEYLNYRWNNSAFSYQRQVLQLFQGDYTVIADGRIIEQQKYNRVYHGQRFMQPAVAGDLEQTLLAAIRKSLNPSLPTYVLLSGGVDSALLLALVQQLVPEVIAITPNHHQHANPELARAKQFAAQRQVPHEILAIDDAVIPQLFLDTTRCIGQAPRHQSSLTLYYTFAALTQPANIIYGEAADTLFGSGAVKSFRARQRKIRQIKRIPATIRAGLQRLVSKNSKLGHLLRDDALTSLLSFNLLVNPAPSEEVFAGASIQRVRQDFCKRYAVDEASMAELTEAELLALFKQWVLDTDVTNHMFETGQMAARFGHQLVTPFLDQQVIAHALQLDDAAYFGSSHVKPLLRELGAKFYQPDTMYLPKLGFPVPHHSWLQQELKGLVEKARCYFGVSRLPASVELDWTLAGLYSLIQQTDPQQGQTGPEL